MTSRVSAISSTTWVGISLRILAAIWEYHISSVGTQAPAAAVSSSRVARGRRRPRDLRCWICVASGRSSKALREAAASAMHRFQQLLQVPPGGVPRRPRPETAGGSLRFRGAALCKGGSPGKARSMRGAVRRRTGQTGPRAPRGRRIRADAPRATTGLPQPWARHHPPATPPPTHAQQKCQDARGLC